MRHSYYNTAAATEADSNRRSSGAAYEDIDIRPQPDIITSNSKKQFVRSQRQINVTSTPCVGTANQYADVDDVKIRAIQSKDQDDNGFSTRTSYAEIAVRDSTPSATSVKPKILTPKPTAVVRYAELDFENDTTPQPTSMHVDTAKDGSEDTGVSTGRVVVPNLGEFETYAEVSERPMTSRQTSQHNAAIMAQHNTSSLTVEQHAPSDDAPADSTVQPVYAQPTKRKRPPEVTSTVPHVSADNNPQVLYAVPDKKRFSDK